MEYLKFPSKSQRYLLRLDAGEEVIATLTNFAFKNGIKAGFLQGIGAVRNITLGYLDLQMKKYIKETFTEEMELISFIGNLSTLEAKPFIHGHVCCSGRDFKPVSGHLFSATVTATGEFSLVECERELIRRFDPELGFNRLSL